MPLDEDACAICEGDRSTNKNPIMFCDGRGCDVPVHKDCYGVDDVPEGEWYCQRCEARRNGKPARIVCCPLQTGALKTTIKAGNFIHIACAKWNPDINHEAEPYDVDKASMDQHTCFQCEKPKGICIKCQEDTCDKWFHSTCAIDAGLITVTKKVPESYSPRCNDHQPQEVINKRLVRRHGDNNAKPATSKRTLRRKGRLVNKRNMMETSSSEQEDNDDENEEEEEEEDEEDDDDEDDDDDDDDDDEVEEPEEEEEEEEDSDDDDMGTSVRRKQRQQQNKKKSSNKNKKKTASATPIKKRRATAPHGKKGGPIRLFMSDQSDSDDDHQMGRASSSSSSSTNGNKNKTTTATAIKNNNGNNKNTIASPLLSSSSSAAASPSPALQSPRGMLGLIEAKRKKSQMEKQKLSLQPPLSIINNNAPFSSSTQQVTTPISATAPVLPSTSITSSSSSMFPSTSSPAAPTTPGLSTPPAPTNTTAAPLQLQQNKPHLASNPAQPPTPHKQKLPNKAHLMPNQAPPNGHIKKPSPVFRDLDDIQNDILGQRRSTVVPITPVTTTTTTTTTSSSSSAASNPIIPTSLPYDAAPSSTMNGERRNTLPDRKPSMYHQQGPPLQPQQQQQQQPRQRPMESPNDINDVQKLYIKSKITEIMEEVLAQPPQKSPSDSEILRQEVMRLKEENRRLQTFRRSVAEVFEGLNVKVPSGLPISVDKIEEYVNELRMMFVRSGAIREQDYARINQCVEDMIIDKL